jgi:predicted phage baseplate assembly protein
VDSVTNKRPAYGGADEETLQDARRRAPQVLKSKDRAVTADDFALLAKETPGAHIKRAAALPLAHPRFPGSEIPGVVTVVIVPESDAPKPVPSEATISLVCACLNKRRLLTTEVYVVPPTYRKVSVKADIIARPQADLAEVERNVERNLIDYFHPFRGGDEGAGWEFGNDIVYSDIYRQILKDPDVDRIDGPVTIYLDDDPQEPYKDVTIEPGELLYCESLQIGVSYRARE